MYVIVSQELLCHSLLARNCYVIHCYPGTAMSVAVSQELICQSLLVRNCYVNHC
jgi:hypothetical protein